MIGDWIADNPGWAALATIGGFLLLLFYACESCSKEKKGLIQKCIKDGRKDYECEALFQGYCNVGHIGGSTVIIPTR